MDFESEPFVRLYVRDTATWNELGFEGQTTLMHLLRRANLAGAIHLMGAEPWQAAVSLCGVPEAIARVGAARMLELGCAALDGQRLLFPRYIAAQTAAASAALRQQESRARRALESGAEPDPQNVPKRWAQPPNTSRNVTNNQPTVWDPVFGARRRGAASEETLAARGAAWLSEATGLEPWAVGGRWATALRDLAVKPEAELRIAARVLRISAQRPDASRILTPQHVLDYWPTYRTGAAPGAALAFKSNGRNGHDAGPHPGPPEVETARAESERCKLAYERARSTHEREAASVAWLEADRKLKSAKDKTGWNG